MPEVYFIGHIDETYDLPSYPVSVTWAIVPGWTLDYFS